MWSHDGILCFCDTLKNAVRLTFPKGAQMKDPHKLFNTRKTSKTARAIDFPPGATILTFGGSASFLPFQFSFAQRAWSDSFSRASREQRND